MFSCQLSVFGVPYWHVLKLPATSLAEEFWLVSCTPSCSCIYVPLWLRLWQTIIQLLLHLQWIMLSHVNLFAAAFNWINLVSRLWMTCFVPSTSTIFSSVGKQWGVKHWLFCIPFVDLVCWSLWVLASTVHPRCSAKGVIFREVWVLTLHFNWNISFDPMHYIPHNGESVR